MKVLFLTHRLPYAPNRGDRIRSYHLLQSLKGVADVHLFSLVDSEERALVNTLPSWLASVTVAEPPALLNRMKGLFTLAGSRPLTHTLLNAPGVTRILAGLARRIEPDVVLAYCSGMAKFAVDGPLQNVPCVIDMVDVDSEKWRAMSRAVSPPWRWIYQREARLLNRFEARACRHASEILVVNAREGKALETIAPGAPVAVVENGVDLEYFRPHTEAKPSQTVVFCGVMDYEPNVDGVVWFAREVWPKVRVNHPQARFVIVGAKPTERIKRLSREDGIEVTGAVPDVRPFLWSAALSVAPVLTARGLQNKVLEALAAGLPVVTTVAVASGLPPSVLPGCVVADDAKAYAAAISALLPVSAAKRRLLAGAADMRDLSWQSRLGAVPDILARAGRPVPDTRR